MDGLIEGQMQGPDTSEDFFKQIDVLVRKLGPSLDRSGRRLLPWYENGQYETDAEKNMDGRNILNNIIIGSLRNGTQIFDSRDRISNSSNDSNVNNINNENASGLGCAERWRVEVVERDMRLQPPTAQARTRQRTDQPGRELALTLWRDTHAWCTHCRMMWMVLEEKKIPYRVQTIPLQSYGTKRVDFLERVNPSGTVPVLQIHDEFVANGDAAGGADDDMVVDNSRGTNDNQDHVGDDSSILPPVRDGRILLGSAERTIDEMLFEVERMEEAEIESLEEKLNSDGSQTSSDSPSHSRKRRRNTNRNTEIVNEQGPAGGAVDYHHSSSQSLLNLDAFATGVRMLPDTGSDSVRRDQVSARARSLLQLRRELWAREQEWVREAGWSGGKGKGKGKEHGKENRVLGSVTEAFAMEKERATTVRFFQALGWVENELRNGQIGGQYTVDDAAANSTDSPNSRHTNCWFFGTQFSIVDAAFSAVMERVYALAYYFKGIVLWEDESVADYLRSIGLVHIGSHSDNTNSNTSSSSGKLTTSSTDNSDPSGKNSDIIIKTSRWPRTQAWLMALGQRESYRAVASDLHTHAHIHGRLGRWGRCVPLQSVPARNATAQVDGLVRDLPEKTAGKDNPGIAKSPQELRAMPFLGWAYARPMGHDVLEAAYSLAKHLDRVALAAARHMVDANATRVLQFAGPTARRLQHYAEGSGDPQTADTALSPPLGETREVPFSSPTNSNSYSNATVSAATDGNDNMLDAEGVRKLRPFAAAALQRLLLPFYKLLLRGLLDFCESSAPDGSVQASDPAPDRTQALERLLLCGYASFRDILEFLEGPGKNGADGICHGLEFTKLAVQSVATAFRFTGDRISVPRDMGPGAAHALRHAAEQLAAWSVVPGEPSVSSLMRISIPVDNRYDQDPGRFYLP